MKRGLKRRGTCIYSAHPIVRTQAPMKRGLKPPAFCAGNRLPSPCPNPGPDEEGIETPYHHKTRQFLFESPNPGPDEEGIETSAHHFHSPVVGSPNPGPDEEGIETSVSNSSYCVFIFVRTQAPMKRGLKLCRLPD